MESEFDFSEPSILAYSGLEYQPSDDGYSSGKKINTFYNILYLANIKVTVMIMHV